jgi:DNA-binding XRE family transcriptional regulator
LDKGDDMRVFIRERRMEKHMTQKQLAEALVNSKGNPMDQSELSRIEKGKTIPSVEIALQISEILKCQVEDLYSRQ